MAVNVHCALLSNQKVHLGYTGGHDNVDILRGHIRENSVIANGIPKYMLTENRIHLVSNHSLVFCLSVSQ